MHAATPFDEANDVLATAERWMNESRQLAIATIVAGDGLVAMRIGQRVIIDADGIIFSNFTSGPIIDAVKAKASLVIASGEPDLLDLPLKEGHARLYIERLG